MKTITLKENEAELLLSILRDAQDARSSMGCNDADKEEETMFSKEELKEMAQAVSDEEFGGEEIYHIPNWGFVSYMINKIEKQID